MTRDREPPQPHIHSPHDGVLHAWCIEPGRMLAGEHPELSQDEGSEGPASRLALLAESGIVTTVDLASRGLSESRYGDRWLEIGRRLGRDHRRLVRPIDNRGVIGGSGYLDLIAEIAAELDAGRPVYVHWAYGVGRTGTVIGVWLRQQGLDFEGGRGIAFRELNWIDARRRYVSLGQIVAFVRSQFQLLDGCYVGGLEEGTEVLEFIASVVRGGYLPEVAGNNDVECAWDNDTNQMTWWIDMKGVRYP